MTERDPGMYCGRCGHPMHWKVCWTPGSHGPECDCDNSIGRIDDEQLVEPPSPAIWEGLPASRYRKVATVEARVATEGGVIHTLEGDHTYSAGDYICGPGAAGEYWPVRKDIFEVTYVPATDEPADLPVERLARALARMSGAHPEVTDVQRRDIGDYRLGLTEPAIMPTVRDFAAAIAAAYREDAG